MKPVRRAMTTMLKFTQFSVRDLLATAGPAILLLVVLCAIAYVLVDPAPPRHVTLSTGQENSAYEEFGKKYAAALAVQKVKVATVRSLGSQDNLQKLNAGRADIAFVQSGSTEQAEAERRGLVSLGSLFTEPIWLFVRYGDNAPKVNKLTDLKGLKINLGPDGSGVPR